MLFPQWTLTLPSHGGRVGHRETASRIHHFLRGDWEQLQAEYFLRARSFTARAMSDPTRHTTPPEHRRLRRACRLAQAGEYRRAVQALSPTTPAPPERPP